MVKKIFFVALLFTLVFGIASEPIVYASETDQAHQNSEPICC